MKILLFNNPRLLFAIAGFIFSYSYSGAQTVNSSWATDTLSASIEDKTSVTNNRTLIVTVSLASLDETDSFSLVLADENDNTVMNIGEYTLKKHQNGFYYVEEKSSHDMSTVLDNVVYFSTEINQDKLSRIKMASLKVRSKHNNKPGDEKKLKTKVPKFKKK